MVDWSPAPGDVTRDPAREVLWELELASWKVWVDNMPKFYDLAVSPDQRAHLTKGTEEFFGLRFRVWGRPENPALFRCTLDFVTDKLTVRDDFIHL